MLIKKREKMSKKKAENPKSLSQNPKKKKKLSFFRLKTEMCCFEGSQDSESMTEWLQI